MRLELGDFPRINASVQSLTLKTYTPHQIKSFFKLATQRFRSVFGAAGDWY